MAEALTVPLLVAAAVLGVAGVAKLRAPRGAVQALRVLGLPGSAIAVRAFAVSELALAAWTIAAPSPAASLVLAALYAVFAFITLVLARRRASCGCFGEHGAPASVVQSAISCALSAVALAAAIAGAHGPGWLLDRSVVSGLVLIVGTAGSVYGTVVAYSQIPPAWGAWSGR